MAFDESLAARIRDALIHTNGVVEKKMFGALCFMLHGNMLVGVWIESLIARLGPDEAEEALTQTHVREFDVTGKPMRNWVLVEPEGLDEDDQLTHWIEKAIQFVRTLPRKS